MQDLILRGSHDWLWGEPCFAYAAIWAGMSVLLLMRRRWPVAVTVVATVSDLVAFYPAAEAVAMFTLGAYARSWAWRWTVLGSSAVLHSIAMAAGHGVSVEQLGVHYAAWVIAPVVLGLYTATRQRLIASLEERERQRERERALLQEQARAGERRRIGREMHDVIAHAVSHMAFRAGTLEMMAQSRDAAWAAAEAETIQALGRKALEELRSTLGLLGPSGADRSTRAPLPRLADLAGLVQRTREAEVPAELHQEGDFSWLEPRHERAVYRVVQEALTNVVKHAPQASTRIDLIGLATSLTVRVHNAPPAAPTQSLPAGGHGLQGMQERIGLLGGTVDAGPDGQGGFLVTAVIPLPTAALTSSTTESHP
ncbi:sensor histidine kinase [Streptomyces flavofungini]|uniref:histidine kinase n=1 Tax=Streptomyces flavofungini TaxID=68200 RepID=A0ABS0XGL9_9ACTN|nr:histidine kinase [Streptomyces flavofungini]MBJ3812373.1 hypothetical protein [Streptomyces flavofungini]